MRAATFVYRAGERVLGMRTIALFCERADTAHAFSAQSLDILAWVKWVLERYIQGFIPLNVRAYTLVFSFDRIPANIYVI